MAARLEVVHAVGVLHRDLKPGNIMLRADGSVALIDFGLAKHVQVSMRTITATGEIFGTPYYMSPEQGHGQQLDERSDLYSLGVIFYEMLMRQKPLRRPIADGRHLHARERADSALAESLRNYQQLLNKLLAKDPIHRFASASALLGRRSRSCVERRPARADAATLVRGCLRALARAARRSRELREEGGLDCASA
jgi:serine/threonine protein kinase